MIVDDIELQEAILNFIKEYFSEVDLINNFNIEFIESNSLLEPKINYLKLYRFLLTAINNLKNLDHEVLDDLITKLYKDCNGLYEFLAEFDKKNKICELVYRKDFLESYKPYIDLKAQVDKNETLKNKYYMIMQNTDAHIKILDKLPTKTEVQEKEYKNLKRQNVDAISNYADTKTTLEKLQKELVLLEDSAYDEFKEQFFGVKDYYVDSLKKVVNLKLFYLDRLLWISAKKSKAISQFFEKSQISDEYSTKTFIKYYLRNINISQSKSSDWHRYLKNCLEEWEKKENE